VVARTAIQKVADQYVRETLPQLPAELGAFLRFGITTLWHRARGKAFENDAGARLEHASAATRASMKVDG